MNGKEMRRMSSHTKTTEKKNRWRPVLILLGVFLCLALVLGSVLLTEHHNKIEYENYIWENYSVTVTLNYFDGTRKMITTLINEPVELDTPPQVEKHTFLGWENERGQLLSPSMISAQMNEEYTAKYIISLDTANHVPYFFPDENGFFHAEDDLSRGDAARMIYSVLAEKPVTTGGYVDIDTDSVYALPAAALRALGITSGSRFYPDESITRGELLQMLAAFFPPAEEGYSFQDVGEDDPAYDAFCTATEKGWIDSKGRMQPEKRITRIEAVLLVNKVLGRDDSPDVTEEQVGGILEYMPGDQYYLPIAEAAVSHTYTASGEKESWETSEPIEKLSEGFSLIGTRLYDIDADGHIVRSAEEEGFRFGSDGTYTSGNAELDVLVNEVIDSLYTEGMSREDLLHELFEYTISSFTYLRRTYYKYGDTTYAPEAAYVMLSTGKGNCYCYAGTFCMFARALGYNAVVYSGTVGKDREPHGWCEIIIEDVPYICDAELMMRRRSIGGELDMYMKRYEELRGWTYVRYV